MNCNWKIALVALLCLSFQAIAQPVEEDIKKGNDFYRQQQYEPAATAYDAALIKDPANRIARFNRASVTYRMSKYSEAIKSFEDLARDGNAADEKAKAFYNKGAILSSQKRLEESIDAYKDALRQNPNDKEARENLQKALLELKKKTPPKKENDKKKQQEQKQQNKKQQPKMSPRDAEQKLKLLEQKEKDLQQRMQKQKAKTRTGGNKDW
jgi:Ca-activated chloride channel family protein